MTKQAVADFSLTPAPLGSVTPRGWLAREFAVQKNGLTGHIEEIWPDLGPDSGWLDGAGENWERGPYYLDGLIPLAYALNDEALKQKAQKWIEWMLQSQREDGYFGPADNPDWWPRIVALKALTQYHEATGDRRVLPLMDRYFRYQLAHIKDQPLAMWAAARGQEQLLPMRYLYEKTGAAYLLDLARILREQTCGWHDFFLSFPYEKTTHAYLNRPLFMAVKRVTLISDWTAKRLKKLRKQPNPIKMPSREKIEKSNTSPMMQVYHKTHSVNLAMALKMPALDALWGGLEDGAAVSRAGLEAITRYHGLASGLFSGDEHLNGRSPSVGAELCLAAEYLYSLQTLLAVTGDGRYADLLEEIAYNAWPAMFTADMSAHQYVQQVNQVECSRKKRGWYDAYSESNLFGLAPNFGCCAANMHQGWPKLLGALMMTTPDGIVIPIYAPCEANIFVLGTRVRVSEKTGYPFGETVALILDRIENESQTLDFALKLRVPAWAQTCHLSLNGAPLSEKPENGFVSVQRIFRAGDRIELSFPSQIRIRCEASGGATVHIGPLLLALPVEAEPRVLRGTAPFADYQLFPRSEWRYAVVEEALAQAEIERREPGELPFGELDPPLAVRLPLASAAQWRMERHSAGPTPEPFVTTQLQLEEKTLIPYGCTRLRIAQFPIATIKEGNP